MSKGSQYTYVPLLAGEQQSRPLHAKMSPWQHESPACRSKQDTRLKKHQMFYSYYLLILVTNIKQHYTKHENETVYKQAYKNAKPKAA